MWLFDVAREFGIEAATAESRGWDAANAGFRCVLTRDRLFGESAARALRRFPHFSVVFVTTPQLRGAPFLEQFRIAWKQGPIQPVAGKLVDWP